MNAGAAGAAGGAGFSEMSFEILEKILRAHFSLIFNPKPQ